MTPIMTVISASLRSLGSDLVIHEGVTWQLPSAVTASGGRTGTLAWITSVTGTYTALAGNTYSFQYSRKKRKAFSYMTSPYDYTEVASGSFSATIPTGSPSHSAVMTAIKDAFLAAAASQINGSGVATFAGGGIADSLWCAPSAQSTGGGELLLLTSDATFPTGFSFANMPYNAVSNAPFAGNWNADLAAPSGLVQKTSIPMKGEVSSGGAVTHPAKQTATKFTLMINNVAEATYTSARNDTYLQISQALVAAVPPAVATNYDITAARHTELYAEPDCVNVYRKTINVPFTARIHEVPPKPLFAYNEFTNMSGTTAVFRNGRKWVHATDYASRLTIEGEVPPMPTRLGTRLVGKVGGRYMLSSLKNIDGQPSVVDSATNPSGPYVEFAPANLPEDFRDGIGILNTGGARWNGTAWVTSPINIYHTNDGLTMVKANLPLIPNTSKVRLTRRINGRYFLNEMSNPESNTGFNLWTSLDAETWQKCNGAQHPFIYSSADDYSKKSAFVTGFDLLHALGAYWSISDHPVGVSPVLKSTDAVNWVEIPFPDLLPGFGFLVIRALTDGVAIFLFGMKTTYGNVPTVELVCFRSTDGSQWTPQPNPVPANAPSGKIDPIASALFFERIDGGWIFRDDYTTFPEYSSIWFSTDLQNWTRKGALPL
jgi:hypothetical protein